MSLHTTIDTSKSLAELTGVDWGPPPDDARELVRERHELHRTPIRELPDAGIVRLLDMGVGGDFLIPWRGRPDRLAELREIVYSAANELAQITDDLERLAYEAAMWRFYAEFERSLSVS